ncbi:hypothetical protein [Phyllobacterium bourgognense]|uniref:Uncharacterized protein n=1 Tax=Phyllobacterium bourgognense TaxID=314236 RepID=A0A368YMM3_9HYPH|nr:hypothetical protein [Phyllobacterium bourgognense]RCW80167.1 hypothetical protein C7476_115132 [Phyllobacterium bourgognense]
MADDMNNGNDASRHYQDAMQAQLGERVTNLGRRQTDLEAEMRSGFKQMETALSGLANETRSSIAAHCRPRSQSGTSHSGKRSAWR